MNKTWQRWLAVLVIVAILAVGAAAWLLLPDRVEPRRVERSGPPAVVTWGSEPVLWLLTRQEEWHHQAQRTERRIRFELHGHDRSTAQRLWSRHLLTAREAEGGQAVQGRILGQQGPVVWLFLNNQPVAVSHQDGSVLGDELRILERNPGLAPMWPRSLDAYTFDERLIVTTADALHWTIDSQTLAATAYRPADNERFARARFQSSTWNGSWQTADFLTRRMNDHERWIGLYTEREAREAADDGFGSNFKEPDRVINEGAEARRRLWLATIGKTRAFSEGRHDRLLSLAPVPGSPTFLQGGLLKTAGLREAFMPGADGGGIVVHRTRVDAQGRLALTRIDPGLKARWSRTLPISELHNRWEFGDRLLLVGSAPAIEGEREARHDLLVSVSLEDGSLKQWNVQRASAEPAAGQ